MVICTNQRLMGIQSCKLSACVHLFFAPKGLWMNQSVGKWLQGTSKSFNRLLDIIK